MQVRQSFTDNLVSDNPRIAAFQVLNAAAALLTIHGYFTNPNASLWEYGFDVGVHVLQAFINEHSSDTLKAAANVANYIRLGSIGTHLLFRNSTVPTFFNLIDTGIHGGNVLSNLNIEKPRFR